MRKILTLATAASLCLAGAAHAQVYQPHMQACLQDLLAAQQEIQQADRYQDHGGYAGRATHHIQEAINDVQAGIAYRNSNAP